MTGHRAGLRALAVAVGSVCVVALAGCGTADDAGEMATVVITQTAGETTASPHPTGEPTERPTAGPRIKQLTASFDQMAAGLPAPVGLAMVPAGGGAPRTFGDQTVGVAWSTSKVPLAIAAERARGQQAATVAAIVDSDNAAAESLWSSLGTPGAAAAAVTAVLREGGDRTTTVPSQRRRAEFSIFGQTAWALDDAATFAAHLPCMPDAGRVLTLMQGVGGNQQWGLAAMQGRTTAVKGGWGPTAGSGYLVRQIGVLTLRDGRKVGVAMSAQTTAGSMDVGTAALNAVGQWMQKHVKALPGGRCT